VAETEVERAAATKRKVDVHIVMERSCILGCGGFPVISRQVQAVPRRVSFAEFFKVGFTAEKSG